MSPPARHSLAALELDRADAALLAAVDDALAVTARRAGEHLVCRLGCTSCCRGPFPINALDARRLRRGLAELATRRPRRAAMVVERARQQRARMARDLPGDPATGRLEDDETALGAFLDVHGNEPCPVLDPATGDCELYAHRPVTCRTYGPPVAIGAQHLPPCHLCFQAASAATVEACRMKVDPEGLEDRALALLEPAGTGGETLIAWAVAAPPQPEAEDETTPPEVGGTPLTCSR